MGQPTAKQMKKFWVQVDSGRITSRHFQMLLDGITLTRFTHRVDYDDPRWKTIDPTRYHYYFDPNEKVEKHFPNTRTGQADVAYEYVTFEEVPSTMEAMKALVDEGLDHPDRAEAETFFDENPGEAEKCPVVAICGRKHNGTVGCVAEDNITGRSIFPYELRDCLGGYNNGHAPIHLLGVRRK